MKAALLMVDMSTEQVSSLSSSQRTRIVDCIQQLAQDSHWTLRLDSRLWLHDDQESTLSRVYPEWGTTMGVPNSQGAALLLGLRSETWQFVEKKHYSSFVDSSLQDTLETTGITDVFLVGINTNYCIFNTAMDSFARGRFRTFVVEQGVGSVEGTAGHHQGLRWIRSHLGSDSVVSVEEVLKRLSSA